MIYSSASSRPARLLAVAGISVIVAIFAGCHSSGTSNQTSADTVATVNGEAITKDEFYEALQQHIPVKQREDIQSRSLTESVGQVVLSELIQNKVLMQMTTQKSVPVTDAEVNDRYNYIKQYAENTSTFKPFEEYLADEGYTPDTFKQEQIKPLVARLNLTSIGQTASDAEVTSYYNANSVPAPTGDAPKYGFLQRAHLQRIVVRTQATANAAFSDAKLSGSFKNFVGQNVLPPSGGGVDPTDSPRWVVLDASPQQSFYPPEVLNAVKTAKKGDVIPPIKAMGAFWLIRVVDIQPATKIPLPQIQALVKADELADKGIKSNSMMDLQRSVMEMLKAANIVIKPKQYQSLAAQFKGTNAAPPVASAPGAPTPSSK